MGISVDTINLHFNLKPNYDQNSCKEDLKQGLKGP